MQPLALTRIHNTNSPVTPIVVSVFAASQNGNEATVCECLTACLQPSCLKNAFFRSVNRERADVCKRSALSKDGGDGLQQKMSS